jgi:serine/threonine protein kinase
VPDFEFVRPIGKGGFGEVWLAINRTTGQARAIKVISSVASDGDEPAAREVASIVRLETNLRCEHPNLLRIDHVGKSDGHLFLVMDLADDVGGDRGASRPTYQPAMLQSRLDAGPLPPEECWQRAEQLLAALATIHGAGLVHRDVKPSNRLFVHGTLKLADFGLVTETGGHISRAGTRSYMPPDGRMDARADVYAAGLTIYEIMTGLPADHFPILGERTAVIAEDLLLRKLNRLVLQACQRDPQRRFGNAQEMLDQLVRPQPRQRRLRVPFRWWLVVCLAPMLMVVAVLMGIHGLLSRSATVRMNFVTRPFEATIEVDGVLLRKADGTPWTTPCTVGGLRGGIHHVVFKRPGFEDLDAGWNEFRDHGEIARTWNSADARDAEEAWPASELKR